MIRVWLFCFSFALVAAQPQPLVLFWPQAGVVPPGTNNTPAAEPSAAAGPQVNPAGVLAAPAVAVPVTPAGAPAAPPPPPAAGTRVLGPGGIPLPGVPIVVPQQPGGTPPASAARPATGPPSGASIGIGLQPGGVSSSKNNDSTAGSALLVSPACSVVVTPGDMNVPAAGGTFEVKGVARPSGCRPALTSSAEWITPARNSLAPVFRFSVEPNPRSGSRIGIFVIADQKVLLRQEGVPGPQFAVAPGSLSFRFDGERVSAPRSLTILSDDTSLTYTVIGVQPWLKVMPQKRSKGAQRFTVSVDPERLRSGRNEGVLLVAPSGTPQAALHIPVLVEVPRLW